MVFYCSLRSDSSVRGCQLLRFLDTLQKFPDLFSHLHFVRLVETKLKRYNACLRNSKLFVKGRVDLLNDSLRGSMFHL